MTWQNNEATGSGIAVGGGAATPASRFVHPELEYHGEWMGECFVTLNVRCAVPVDFEIGDYIIYRGEKFVINYNPTVVKKARRGTYGEGFTYDNVKFNSLSYELTDIRMLDYVLGDNDVHYSSLPKFSFFCNDVDDLADRLQVNADRYCNDNGITGRDRWLFVTPSQSRSLQRCGTDTDLRGKASAVYAEYFEDPAATSEEKVNQNVSVSNQTVWDTMKNIKDVFGLNFVVRGRVVVIGAAGLPTQDVFSYGKGNGLYEIERTADSEQQIITKLYAYGSDKNLPTRYYANLGMQCWTVCYLLDVDGVQLVTIPIPPTSAYFKNEVDVASLGGTKAFAVTVKVGVDGEEHQVYVRDTAGIENFPMENYSYVFGDDVPPLNIGDVLYFTKGIDKDKWPGSKEYPENIPNNMALNVLMLPGFGDMNGSLYQWVKTHGGTNCVDATGKATWRGHTAYFSKEANNPYILSENYLELGIREATKNFDGSDGDEIYPTITGTGHDTIVDAEVIKDDGAFADGDIPTFTITLPDFGSDFLLNELLQNDSAIEMTSGYCGGRSFTINDAKQQSNGTWLCTCQRDPDEDLDIYFPYAHKGVWSENQVLPYQLRGGANGDKYVLTGIEMTETYVNAAAVNLLEAALVFLEQNDYTRYTFSPKVDELFMARQNDEAVASRGTDHEIRSYHDSIKEGDIMLFDDDDLDVDGSVFIDNLTIKEYGNGQIPTYEVTLRNDKQVGTIQRLQDQINSLSSGGGVVGVGGGGSSSVNIPQIRQLIQAYGKELFISKIAADVANGLITFLKGIQIGAEGAWGWVKEITVEGEQVVKAWFKNLYADYLEPTIMKVADKILGPLTVAGSVSVQKDEHNQGGDISVAGNINAPNGSVNAQDGNFTGSVTTKNLTVTGLAHFFELMIDKLRSSGGAFVFTPADGFSVEDVENTTFGGIACKRLWWRASDGETETGNQWLVGDQAICMSFNLAKKNIGGVMTDVSNKMFWSVVCDKDTEEHLYPNGDTAMSHYITIYSGTGSEQVIPTDSEDKPLWDGEPSAVEIGDDIAMLGHRMQDAEERASEDMKARQSAVYITAYASYDTELTPPLMAFYKGVDDFDLSSHRGTYMDANGSRFVGRFVSSSTNQDIENLMNGSEIDIIYGNGNPNTVSTPHNAWNDAEKLRRVDKTLYFDLDLEPASEGGRLWKWTRNTTTGTGYIWVQINDVDSTAALDKIADVASDGVLTGGAEKTRVYLEWVDAKKSTISLLAQATENEMNGSSYVYDEDNDRTCGSAVTGLQTAFANLSQYLNNKVAFVTLNPYTIPNGYPAWINPNVAQGETESAIKQSVILPVWTEKFPTLDTGAKVYRRVWDDYYNAVVEITRAMNAWQYKAIDEMGDDGMLDPAEKATLRQIFSDCVKGWYVDAREASAIMPVLPADETSSYTGITQRKLNTASSQLRSAINAIGSYMAGYQPTPNDQDNPTSWSYSEYGWYILPSMEDGFDESEYPLWLQKGPDSDSDLVDNNIWDYFWNDYANKRDTFTKYLAQARQYQIEHVEVELAKTFYVYTTDGLPTPPYKVGDHMYRVAVLKDPVTGVESTGDGENYYYNHYICIDDCAEGGTPMESHWKLLSAAQAHMMYANFDLIYQAIFSETGSSSIVQRINSIASEVNKVVQGRNLIVNSDYSEGTDRFTAYSSTSYVTLSIVSASSSSLPSGVIRAMQIINNHSTNNMGIQLSPSTSGQPFLRLESGKSYRLSFYAKSTAGSSPSVTAQRSGTTILSSQSVSASWDRFVSNSISGDDVARYFRILFSKGTYQIAGMQLEEGSEATGWTPYADTKTLQSQILQTAEEISLAVKVDGETRSGLTLNTNGTMEIDANALTINGTMNNDVTINGDRLHIENDLDIKGLTTENVTRLERDNQHPIVINMGILQNKSTGTPLKSIQIESVNQSAELNDISSTDAGFCQMVVLPFYDEFVGNTSVLNWWWGTNGAWDGRQTSETTWNTDSPTSPLYGSFTLFTKSGYDDSKTRVVAWKENGTRLTIANEIDLYARNWKAITGTGYADPITNWLARRAVLVCADARIVSATNTLSTSAYRYIGSYAKESDSTEQNPSGNDPVNDSGRFSCGGYMSRFIIILPGQTLQLRSQIIRMNERKVLNWVVENPSEFTTLPNFPIELLNYTDYQAGKTTYGLYLEGPSAPAFNPSHDHTGTCDVILGPSILTKIRDIGLSTYANPLYN